MAFNLYGLCIIMPPPWRSFTLQSGKLHFPSPNTWQRCSK
jgi:hypothetical protein